ncbi:MAG TPA: hypothetical protein VEC57_15790 [Candidatus Limnocylindrales bacterium]|nr:hypothetical protein [Candidatus Limnocylindrales bacterium]
MLWTRRLAVSVLFPALLAAPAAAGNGESMLLGPSAYTSEADSPLDVGTVGVCVENFEDGTLTPPGVTGNGTFIGPSGITDSVDGDDGSIDGSGAAGHSYFNGNGSAGIQFTFSPTASGGLPTTAGMVWTDGGLGAGVTLEVFGPTGTSIGTFGPFPHADNSNSGETAEDRFYGYHLSQGISGIKLSNPGGGIEVDHLQLNNCFVCGDTSADMEIKAGDALFALKAAVGTENCALCICDVNQTVSITAVDSLIILKNAVGQDIGLECPPCLAVTLAN